MLNTQQLISMIEIAATYIREQGQLLNALDSAVGDGDHGTALTQAFADAVNRLQNNPPSHPADVFLLTGTTIMNAMGGASGALFGTLFLRMGAALRAQESVSGPAFAQALKDGLEGVMKRGKAQPGDKTMVDALAPAVQAFASHSEALRQAFDAAASAAEQGAANTASMQARHGRARFAMERSIGHVDAGATSISIIFSAFRDHCKGVAHGEG